MDALEFTPLSEVGERELMDLMNDPRVGRLMPLLAGGFSTADCRAFQSAKQRLWEEHGFGPWAFRINGVFAGWGGLQPEQGDADFALVLHPNYWGWGRRIFEAVRAEAFGAVGLGSITALLPPNRANTRAITRLGFVEDGEVAVGGASFRRYRLAKSAP